VETAGGKTMGMRDNLRQEYLNRTVMTASPAELVVMLFDACIKDIKLAQLAMEEKKPNYSKVNEYMIKAQMIITELISSLDMSYEISGQILPIYEFVLSSLRNANVKKDMSQMDDMVAIISEQRDAWAQIVKGSAKPGSDEVMVG
jgi:flagellar protein FliS